MTAVLNLEEKINQVKKTLLEVPEEEQNGKMAKAMRENLAKYQEELKSQAEKKNEVEAIAAVELASSIEHKPSIESSDNSLNIVVNIPVSTKGNNKRVEDANKVAHFFDTEDAAKKFQYYNRERLRSKLKSWNKKNHKTKEGKEMMYLVVSYFLAQIEGVISYSAKPEYKEALRKKTYSLGESANDKTYCFDMEKLRKDFDF